MASLIELSEAADELIDRESDRHREITNLVNSLNDEQRVALSQAWSLTATGTLPHVGNEEINAKDSLEKSSLDEERLRSNLSPLLRHGTSGGDPTVGVHFVDAEVGAVFTYMIRSMSRFVTGGLGPKLVRRSLLPTAVSAFEYLISSLIDHALETIPAILSSSEYAFTLKELESYESMQDARKALRQRKVDSLLSDGMEGWQKFFARRDVGIDLGNLTDGWPLVREFIARRNILIHNDGVVDSKYVRVAGDALSREPQVGDRVFVGADYLKQRIDCVVGLGCALAYRLWVKFHPAEIGLAQQHMVDLQQEMIETQFWGAAIDIRETIADATYVCRELLIESSIHRWTGIKFGNFSTEEMRKEVSEWDISDLDEKISHAKFLLLDETEKANEALARLYSSGNLALIKVRLNPLYRGFHIPGYYDPLLSP
jgi:hypothetical protein